MTTSTRYTELARSANRIALLLRRLGGDGSHWQDVRARWMALARQERGSAQVWAMGIAVILLGAPAVVLDMEQDGAQERLERTQAAREGSPQVSPFTLGQPLVQDELEDNADGE